MDIQGSGGGGPQKNNDDKPWSVVKKGEKDNPVKEELSPSMTNMRGVGNGGRVKAVIKQGNSGFTAAQLKELEGQTRIHKHLVAGLPVPFHLVLPIWKSVATTYGTSQGAIYKHYPSFVGFSPQGFDYRNMIDPEPGRCRRTDGKKWRCSRNVVPDQKYCVQHMHRGRQRSRKPVEAPDIASPSSDTPPNNSKVELRSSTLPTSVGLQLMTRSSGNTDSYYGSKKTVSCTSGAISPIAAMATNITTPATAVTTNAATTTAAFMSTTNNQTIGNNGNGNHAGNNWIIRGSSNGIIASRNLSPGLGFSTKSVLRVIGCSNSLCFDRRNGMELEPGRCRRTDGKKWRCSRNVIPDQKYCGRHMHRGAKKRVKIFQTDTDAAASAATSNIPWLPPATAITCRTVRAIPNTNLSISIPGSPEKSNSSTSSDTTLSDTSITAYAVSSNVS
ncbi:growth-regulating factor 2 isoform X1 [Ziziphus jujuba]|uniref:Growth-regulating factor n=2 Tax=Ziziphus jujuba TaxID=326968 RepID=A0A6P4A5V5_ZIZJJ|nr:growth-regulating factor 2 isoform X1 [Ziziphus jujuba]